jgi:hypothetical protein
MIAHPNGDIYVTDGYRNARVHRFTRDGRFVKSCPTWTAGRDFAIENGRNAGG